MSDTEEKVAEHQRNATVYVNNINEKIRGEKLRNGLKQVFSPFGKIRKIYIRKSLALRGQAFIVYDNLEAADNAVGKQQNFSFYGKPLRVAYAAEASNITLKKQGKAVEKRPAHAKKGFVSVKLEGQKKAAAAPVAIPVAHPFAPGYPHVGNIPGGPLPPQAAVNGRAPPPPPQLPPVMPNNILFAENLPKDVSQEMLETLFKQYPGLKEVRMIPGRACAFIDFGTEDEATVALQGLKDFKLTADQTLTISYARK